MSRHHRLRPAVAAASLVLSAATAFASGELRFDRLVPVDRFCCIHPGEFCPAVIIPLPPSPHSRSAFYLEIVNVGTTAVPGPLRGTLSAGFRPGVSVISGEVDFASPIPAGGSSQSLGAFGILVQRDVSCAEPIQLQLQLTDGDGNFHPVPFDLTLDCPGCAGPCVDRPPIQPIARLTVVRAASSLVLGWQPDANAEDYNAWTAEAPPWSNPRVRVPECSGVAGTTCRVPDPALPAGVVGRFDLHGACGGRDAGR